METQLFTFGCGHTFSSGYVVIEAETKGRCRELMFETFGEKWSMQYDHDHLNDLEKYGCQKLCVITETPRLRRTCTETQIYVV